MNGCNAAYVRKVSEITDTYKIGIPLEVVLEQIH